MRKLFIAMFTWALASAAFGAHSFLPENDLHLEDGLFEEEGYGITEASFNKVANTIYAIYKPIVKSLGGNLVMKLRWSSSTVNAYADRNDGNWNITFFGGLARRKEITEGGFAVVVCHELAHHIAGLPLYYGDDWASNEGQSDSMAVQVCLKKYYTGVKEDISTLSSYAVNKCKSVYTGQALRECYWRMAGAKSCADLLGTLGGEKPRFDTPDQTVVSQTQDSHPGAQCRLDQYVAATLCKKSWNDAIIPDESNQDKYNCERARCWYAP